MVRNVFVIAGNEFGNLARSKLMLITGAIYFLLFAKCLIELRPPGDEAYTQTLFYYHMLGGKDSDYYTGIMLVNIMHVLTFYGSFLGIILGVCTVAIERYGNTLNTLVVKPLYRDTIINGKLLGCSMFILSVFVVTILAYTGYITIAWGEAFSPLAGEYLIRLPIVALISLIYVLMFFSAALLISLLFTDLAFALILSTIFKFFMIDSLSGEISGKLSGLLGWSVVNPPFLEYIPDGIMSSIFKGPVQADSILNPASDLLSTLCAALPNIVKLATYVLVVIVVSYIAFLRRDVT
ncbi:ABC transporter permease [Methanocella arvoryzae]|uniref:ABC-type transport system, permease component n=1 Tax=Methanocella arvoryzae (strain DSM 22066 / NBRC 105507 / MRE50) TaxID=351160 RepID=Q0W8Y4_METAR|nr:ABC transporter permease subunit [Methanocella arvoryzae]CAJ35142.1 conserved hypothetical protein [Methanocella arvoryzae MRE50]